MLHRVLLLLESKLFKNITRHGRVSGYARTETSVDVSVIAPGIGVAAELGQLVEPGGIEPPTSCVQGRRSPS